MKRLIRNIMDVDHPKHFHSMIFAIAVLWLLIAGSANAVRFLETVKEIPEIKAQNEIMRQQIQRTEALIEEMNELDIQQSEAIRQVEATYERDRQKQEAWNAARENLSDENLHITIQEIIKESEEATE